MEEFLDTLLGIGSDSLTWWQMAVRAVIVFIAALLIMRIGNKRIFGKQTAFDIVLGIIYGSILSRAITGNSPFWPTLAAALTLVLLHRFLAFLAYNTSGFFGPFIKGNPVCLIKDGEVQQDELKKHNLTDNDLQEALRVGGVTDAKDVAYGYLERSGDISIVKKDS